MEYTRDQYMADLQNESMDHLKTREHFQAFYDHQGKEENQLAQKYVPHRSDWIKPTPGGKILELGCHAGFNLIHWLVEDTTREGVGVDVSETLIKAAHESSIEQGVVARATFVQSFIEDLPDRILGMQPTDVMLTETLEHVQEVLPVLSKAVTMAQGANRLWISAPATRVGNFAHVRGIPKEELKALLNDLGIDDSKMTFTEATSDGYPETRCEVNMQ